MAKWYMVLEDGRFSELEGCAIVGVPDNIEDKEEFVTTADAYYCFGDTPMELEPNNGQTLNDIDQYDYLKCSGCGEMFNPHSGFEQIMFAQHTCS